MTAKCPECNYDFSDKTDFLKHNDPGQIIQCPSCGKELRLNEFQQLEALDLTGLDYGEPARRKSA